MLCAACTVRREGSRRHRLSARLRSAGLRRCRVLGLGRALRSWRQFWHCPLSRSHPGSGSWVPSRGSLRVDGVGCLVLSASDRDYCGPARWFCRAVSCRLVLVGSSRHERTSISWGLGMQDRRVREFDLITF